MRESVLPISDPDDVRRFRDDLVAAGFSDEGVLEVVGVSNVANLKDASGEVVMQRTDDGSPLSTLIRLLLLCRAVPLEAAARALPTAGVDVMMRNGMLGPHARGVVSNFQVLPFLGLLLAVDKPRRAMMHGQVLAEDYVMAIGGSTLTLANLTVRSPSRATLDLGSGCGVHAFLAARHSERVDGVDINARANDIARFNAALNGITNTSFHTGDMTDPVRDRRFDLIVSNPPFVVSPERRFVYRDSQYPLDGMVPEIVRRCSALLNEGGFLQVLCNWCNIEGVPIQERLAHWFAGLGCDVWIHEGANSNPEQYAHNWITTSYSLDPPGLRDKMREWLAYYRAHRVESISFGILAIRRRSATASSPNWLHQDQSPERFKFLGPAGEHVIRRMDAMQMLHSTTDDALLGLALAPAPDSQIHHLLTPQEDGSWSVSAANVRLAAGFVVSAPLDAITSKLLTGCNGARPLSALLASIAPEAGVEPEALVRAALPVVRKFIEIGILIPPAKSGAAASA